MNIEIFLFAFYDVNRTNCRENCMIFGVVVFVINCTIQLVGVSGDTMVRQPRFST